MNHVVTLAENLGEEPFFPDRYWLDAGSLEPYGVKTSEKTPVSGLNVLNN